MIENSLIAPAATKAVASIIGSYIGKKLSFKKLDKGEQKQILLCIEELCEQWLISILKSLQAVDYNDAELRDFLKYYTIDLEKFVKDDVVAEELLKPLTETTTNYLINAAMLQNHWENCRYRALPEDFDINSICNLYIKRVKKVGIISHELRSLYLAQLSQDKTNFLLAIRGYWPDFNVEQYNDRVKIRYTAIDLSALTPPIRDDLEPRILLQDVFMPQKVKENRPPRELSKKMWQRLHDQGEVDNLPDDLEFSNSKRILERWTQQRLEPVLNILEHRKLMILGDPGSGKSSLVRYLLLSTLNSPKDDIDWLEPLKGHLPLLIELRNYVAYVKDGRCKNFVEYFHYLGESEGYGLNHLDLHEQLKNCPALVLFDGLDEIFDPVLRDKITQEIIGFSNQYLKVRVLVTSRIIGYQGEAFDGADFKEYTLQDLDVEQIHTFAEGWFRLVFRDLPDEVSSRTQRVQQAVERSPAIRQLAGNPLLLTIIAIIAKHQELPRERVLVYEHAVKVLCHHWEITGHKIEDTPADFMHENDKLSLLKRIAVRMQQASNGLSGNVIPSDDLQQEIEGYLSQRWQQSPTDATRITRGMIEQLRIRNFILCFYGVSLYGFVHRTFLEYFCAANIVELFEKKHDLSIDGLKKLFVTHYQDDVWHEILRLVCGMVDAKFAGNLIDEILPERKLAREKTKALTLAIQCLAEISDLNKIPETSNNVLECLCGWFENLDNGDNNETEKFFEKNAIPSVEIIGYNWIDSEKHIAWLKLNNKITTSMAGVFCFGRVVNALWSNKKETQQYLIKLSQSNEDISMYMAFDALARCFKSETRELLAQLFLDSKEYFDTHIIISTLVTHYQNKPETYDMVKQSMQDESPYIRRTGIDALAKYYQKQPETYNLIKACIQNKHEIVRRAAVNALSEHFQDNPEAYELIKHCVTNKRKDVRRVAINALAKNHQNHPETYDLIKKCLQNKNQDIYQATVYALAKYYQDKEEIQSLLKKLTYNKKEDTKIRSTAFLIYARNYTGIKKKLLSSCLDGRYPWIDPLQEITQVSIEKTAEKLSIRSKEVYQYYQEIAVDIPLIFEEKK